MTNRRSAPWPGFAAEATAGPGRVCLFDAGTRRPARGPEVGDAHPRRPSSPRLRLREQRRPRPTSRRTETRCCRSCCQVRSCCGTPPEGSSMDCSNRPPGRLTTRRAPNANRASSPSRNFHVLPWAACAIHARTLSRTASSPARPSAYRACRRRIRLRNRTTLPRTKRAYCGNISDSATVK